MLYSAAPRAGCHHPQETPLIHHERPLCASHRTTVALAGLILEGLLLVPVVIITLVPFLLNDLDATVSASQNHTWGRTSSLRSSTSARSSSSSSSCASPWSFANNLRLSISGAVILSSRPPPLRLPSASEGFSTATARSSFSARPGIPYFSQPPLDIATVQGHAGRDGKRRSVCSVFETKQNNS